MKLRSLLSATVGIAAFAGALLAVAAPSVAAGSLPTLTLALSRHSVIVGGSMTSGAVNVSTTVTGENSDSPVLIQLKPGVSAGALTKALARLGRKTPLDAIDPLGSIVFDGYATSGAKTIAQTELAPGDYVAVNNGGGSAAFKVSHAASPASLPKPAATVKAIDFAYRGAGTLHDGDLVRFENDGYLIHMVQFARVKGESAARSAENLLLKGSLASAFRHYGTGVNGTFAGPLSPGAVQQQVITAPPGVYVIFCAMNSQDGRLHTRLGMFRTLHIVK